MRTLQVTSCLACYKNRLVQLQTVSCRLSVSNPYGVAPPSGATDGSFITPGTPFVLNFNLNHRDSQYFRVKKKKILPDFTFLL